MQQYCLYLRKSRADAEAEARGEGETLARHEKILLDLAKKQHLNITEIYREIVSGETIAARPVMQRLLHEVEQGIWTGVLVVEIERLARGDTIDQGIMAQTFKYSDTKIITPLKTYNPNNEFDEEYFEFGLFMSRREYKTINRRLQRGRISAVQEGKYVGNKTPYGYKRIKIKNGDGWTLEPIEEEAEVIRMIFEWYTTGEKLSDGSYKRLGSSLIAQRLNSMGIPSKTGKGWVMATIRGILANPVYCGKIRWNHRPQVKKMVDGEVSMSRPRNNTEDCIIVDGLHPPIIPEKKFNMAQELIKKNPPRPVNEKNKVKNPLSGLVICGKCGRKMVRRPYTNKNQLDYLICAQSGCNNVSSLLHVVESKIIDGLSDWLEEYKLKWNINTDLDNRVSPVKIKRKALNNKQTELNQLIVQLDRTHDLLEQGIYDTNKFLERSRLLSEKIEQTKTAIAVLESELNTEIVREESKQNIIPKVEKLIEVYYELPDAKAKNDLLKDALEKIVYTKESSTRWHGSLDDFEIVLFPKIPGK